MREHGDEKRMVVVLEDIGVMYLKAENGVSGAKETFDTLERKLPSLRGRRFYGTYDPRTGEYRACVALQAGDDPQQLGLQQWVIPGGSYAREKMRDWAARIPDIGKTFMAMAEREKDRADDSRPSIEFYRSQDELILLLPVRAGASKG